MMRRGAIAFLVTIAGLAAVSVAPAAASAAVKHCHAVSYTYPHTHGEGRVALNDVTASGLTCHAARTVAKRYIVHGRAPSGWRARRHQDRVILTAGAQRVTGKIAN